MPTDITLRVVGNESMMSRVNTCVFDTCCTQRIPSGLIVRGPMYVRSSFAPVMSAVAAGSKRTTRNAFPSIGMWFPEASSVCASFAGRYSTR